MAGYYSAVKLTLPAANCKGEGGVRLGKRRRWDLYTINGVAAKAL
jgi:hypothetical protein